MPETKQTQPLKPFEALLPFLEDAGEDSPVILGGQAVQLLGEVFVEVEPELRDLLPCWTNDLDFLGSRALVSQIAKTTGLRAVVTDPFAKTDSPLSGAIDLGGRHVHVLFTLRHAKISTSQLRATALLVTYDGRRYRVIHPLLLVKEKTRLLHTVNQRERNDLQHVKILLLCVRGHLRSRIEEAGVDPKKGRVFVNLLHEVGYFARSRDAVFVSREFGIDWEHILPLNAIYASKNPKIITFREKEFHRVKLPHS